MGSISTSAFIILMYKNLKRGIHAKCSRLFTPEFDQPYGGVRVILPQSLFSYNQDSTYVKSKLVSIPGDI
jgi:hypothetical protein